MTWLLRLLLLVALFYVARAILSRLFGQSSKREQGGRSEKNFSRREMRSVSGHTVKDPQCGTYVTESIALPATIQGKTYYFCSEKCRRDFEASREGEKQAADV